MNIALLLSGGVGARLSARVPKQYITVDGKMIVTHTLLKLYEQNDIDAVQIVAAEEWREKIVAEQKHFFPQFEKKFRGFSDSGQNRQMSILNGLRDIKQYAVADDVVMVHDAVRPLISSEDIMAGFAAVVGHDGVMPVLPMKDTVYLSSDGKCVTELLRREQVFAGQAPEFFRLGKYLAANEGLLPDKILVVNGSTEPAVMSGMDIVMIPGDEGNFKITTQGDLDRYISLLSERA